MTNETEFTKGRVGELAESIGLVPGMQPGPDEGRKVWLKLGSEIGRLEGLFIGKRSALECILAARFAAPDERIKEKIKEKIEMATLKQLDHWILLAATATTIGDVFLVASRTRPQPGGGD